MIQPLLLNCDNDGERLRFLENVEHYPILRLDDLYRVDMNILFHFPFGSAGFRDDGLKVKGYNEPAIRSELRFHQLLIFLSMI